jgi:hypothetical protein
LINFLPIWAIALIIAAIIVICGELGFYIGARTRSKLHESPYGVLQAAVFGLLALLIAFSFSLGLARYDARRAAIVTEADSIRTLVRRSELLDARSAARMRGYLSQYVDARIAFAGADDDVQAQANALRQSATLERRMWNVAVAKANETGHPEVLRLFVEALDRAIEEGDEVEAILMAHIPDEVVYVLVVVIAFAGVLLGVGYGRTESRGTLAFVLFAAVLAAVVSVNIDLDRPQRGFIIVSLEPLTSLHQYLGDTAGPH